jgi:hypothetical protein
MKEFFTKSFWEGVKKTFEEAQHDSRPASKTTQALADDDLATRSAAPPPGKCGSPAAPEQKLPAEPPA